MFSPRRVAFETANPRGLRALWLTGLLLSTSAAAQEPVSSDDSGSSFDNRYTLPHTEVLSFHSDKRDVDHVLYVSLPGDYHQRQDRYPVVFLLDPDYSFAIAHNVVEHFVDRGNLPPMILVGVGYPGQSQDRRAYRIHRSRDYTPSHTATGGYGPEFQELSGGGPAFRDSLAEELIPFLDRRYRTSGDRTLVGHSYGGLLTTFVLLTRPGLFRRYLAVSPSYWYHEQMIFRLEEQSAEGRMDLPARVALVVGALENRPLPHRPMVDLLQRFGQRLRSRRYPTLELETLVFPEETHNSVFPVAFTRAIRWLFREPVATPD